MSSSTSSTITTYYQKILFRDPTASELSSWSSSVGSGVLTLEQVRTQLTTSTEATNFVDPVIRLYQAAFGRVPESDAALDFYADRLRAGTASVSDIAANFAASPEFAARYGTTGPSAAYITALYVNVLGRTPAASEVDWYLAQAAKGMNSWQMLQGFSQSPEFQTRSDAAVDAFLNANAQGTAVFTGPLQIVVAGQTFTLTTSAPTVTEGDAGTKAMTFQLTLDRAPTEAVTVNYQTLTSGTATAGTDFVAASGAVTFAAGQTNASVSVTINGDTAVEANETVQVQFTGSRLAASVTATGTITNDDTVNAPIGAVTDSNGAANSVAENSVVGTVVGITASATDATAGETVTYALTTNPGNLFAIDAATGVVTVAGALDFETAASHSITVQATSSDGSTSVADFTITVTDVAEGRTFTLTAGADTGAAFTGANGDDIFNAIEIDTGGGNVQNTWTTGDALDGGLGEDTLNIIQTGAIANPFSATVTGIETINATSNTTNTNLNTTTFTGLETLNVTAVGDVTARAAATTAMAVTNGTLAAGNTVTINGGSTVTATTTAAVTAGAGAGTGGGTVTVGAAAAAAGAVVVNTTSTLADAANQTTGTGTVVRVTGGTSVTVNNTLATTGTSDANTDALTGGAVTVTGNANTTTVSVTQTAARDNSHGQANPAAAIVNGGVTITDGAAATAVADTITTVTLANYGVSTIESGALATLNLSGTGSGVIINGNVAATNQTATTLNLNLNGLTGNSAVRLDANGSDNSAYTTVNLNSSTAASILGALDVALTAQNVPGTARVTALNISGDAALTLLTHTALTATATITSTNTEGVALGILGTTQTFIGGDGNDAITLQNAHNRNVVMGAGDDTVVYGGALAATRTVDAGQGTDTIVMTAVQAAAASANATFNATFSGFEALELLTPAGQQAVNLAALNGVNAVTTGDILAHQANLGELTITGFTTGGTLTLTSNIVQQQHDAGTYIVEVTNALLNPADVFNIELASEVAFAGDLDLDTVVVADVQTVNIAVNDASVAANGSAAVVHNLGLDAAQATTITVSGNNGLTLTGTLGAVTRFDASGVVANGNGVAGGTDAAAGLAVTFTAANAAAVTIIGGAGADVLTGHTGNDVITGGAGADAINGRAGADTLTGGAGADTFRFVASESGALTGGNSITGFDVITDFTAGANGDVLDLGTMAGPNFVPGAATLFDALTAAERTTVAAEATLLAAANAALTAATDSQWTAFAWQGTTYAIYDTNDTFDNTFGVLVQLTGVNVADLVAANFA